jgi:MFS family permease
LAAEVGIAPSAVIVVLMLDQAIFTITDTAMGIIADRIASLIGHLGVFAAALTALSCAAFAALPFVAGAGAKFPLIALIVIWAITSSALRAPPLILLGKYCATPRLPFLAALVMLGFGLAGAVSPYLGAVLRDVDPRLPFVISSVVLLMTRLGLSRVERDVAPTTSPKKRPGPQNRLARCRCCASSQ